MNYLVPSCTLWNPKSIGIEDNSCYDIVESKPFVCQGLVVPSHNQKVSSIDQNSIVNVALTSTFNIKGTLFMIDMLVDVVDMVMHCSHPIKPFFCGGREDFVLIIQLYFVWIKTIGTSVGAEIVGSGGCGIVGKFCKRQPCSPTVLPIIAVDAAVLLACLDCSFTQSISLWLVGSRES